MRRLGHEVTGLWNAVGRRAAQYAHQHQIPYATSDIGRLVSRNDVDAVYVSTVNTRPTQVRARALVNTIATRTKRQSATCGGISVIIGLKANIPSKNYYIHGIAQFFASFVTFEVVCDRPSEKRKVDSSILSLTTELL
jgi:hypothetical protein